MLRVLGSNKRFCDGLTRRDLLHVGALAPLGLSLAGWSRASASAIPAEVNGFGSAKRCILLYLWGFAQPDRPRSTQARGTGGSPRRV